MNFGQFARKKRQEAHLSLDAVAKALGYKNRSNIHRLEFGELEWKLNSVIKLAHLLNVSTSELLKEYERDE